MNPTFLATIAGCIIGIISGLWITRYAVRVIWKYRSPKIVEPEPYVAPHVTGTLWYAPWYGGEDHMAFMPGEYPPEDAYVREPYVDGAPIYARPLEAQTSTLFMTFWSNGTYEYNLGCGLILVPKDTTSFPLVIGQDVEYGPEAGQWVLQGNDELFAWLTSRPAGRYVARVAMDLVDSPSYKDGE